MFFVGLTEKIVFALVQAFTLFTHATDANGTLTEVARLTHTCPVFFQSCGNWYFLPGVDHPATHVWYGTLILITLSYLFCAQRSRYSVWLLVPGYAWVFVLVLVLAYDAGHASDYMFLILGGVVFFSRQHFLGYFDTVFGSLYLSGAVLSAALWFSEFPMYGITPFLSPAMSDALAWVMIIAAAYVGARMVFGVATTDEYWFLVFVHSTAGVLFETVFALTIVPFMLLRVHSTYAKRSEKKIRHYASVGIILAAAVLMHGYLWYMTTNKGRVCQRSHVGITTAYNIVACDSKLTIASVDGEKSVSYSWDGSRPCRCDYYTRWFEAQQWCKKDGVTGVMWNFSRTSIRGKVETLSYADACSIPFSLFSSEVYPHK